MVGLKVGQAHNRGLLPSLRSPASAMNALWSLLALMAGLLCAAPASAQAYPHRPVHLIVHNNPGSAPDLLARYLAGHVGDAWKAGAVVDNRSAAAGIVAAETVAQAPADGYNLLVGGDGPITILPQLQKLPYDAQHSLIPVAALGQIDFVLVTHPGTGWRSIGDFVHAAQAQPGRFNYASAGNGSPLQFAMELLKQRAGFFATHIPYRGGPLALQDVAGGQVDAMFIAIGPALPLIRSGRLVALATSGEQRSALLPGVPTVAETFKGFRAGAWFGLFAPAGTPPAVLDRIAGDVRRTLQTPAAQRELASQGIEVSRQSPTDFQRQVSSEFVRYAQLVKTAGIHTD